MQINRLFEIIYLLLDKKSMTAKDLAKHFEVSGRTIYRDIETLAQAGIPIYTSKGSGGGIHLTENFVLNKSVLTEEEKKNILSSLHGMNALNIGEFKPVLSKMAAFFGLENEEWIEVDFSSWNESNPIIKHFDDLKKAILSLHKVTFKYSGVNGRTETRTVEPMKLVLKGYDWYLLAWCSQREDFRFFKLFRMCELNITEEMFKRKQMPLKAEIKDRRFKVQQVKITVQIAKEMAYRVYDEFMPSRRTEQADGSFIVDMEMSDDEWTYGYLMTFGHNLKVIAPQNIKDEIINRYKKALLVYSDLPS